MRMGARAIPWNSRWFQLSVALALAAILFMLSLGVVSGQAALPPAKSEQGNAIRDLYFLVFGVAAVVFIGVELAIIWVVVRYRRRNDELPPQIHGSTKAEIIWTVIPTMIVIALFVVSLIVLDDIESGPEEGEPFEVIDVVGSQWTWTFNYSAPVGATTTSALSKDPAELTLGVTDGSMFERNRTIRVGIEHMRVTEISGNTLTVERKTDGTVAQNHSVGAAIDRIFNGTETEQEGRLEGAPITPVVTVPVGRTVRFNLASMDVIHSFYTPQFLVKLDANPGRVQSLDVKVTQAGLYQGQCAEFCGRNHARMIFSVRALEQPEYDAWLAEKTPGAPSASAAEAGASSDAATTTANEALQRGDERNGEDLFFANGCNACHGDNGQGGIGPTIASTGFSFEQVLAQYRSPRGIMPPFDASRVADDEARDIYAWLQTLPLPAVIVPGLGTP